MIYIIAVILAVAIAVLFIRLRLRIILMPGRRLIFLGLGRTGPQYDLDTSQLTLKLFGLTAKTFDTSEKKKTAPESAAKKIKKREKKGPKRHRSASDILGLIPTVSRALWSYIVSLFRATRVEELEGEISAGFDSPDLTGTAFGYYQAIRGAAPSLSARFNFIPVWDRQSFEASLRASFAIPLYAIALRSLVLVWQLPLKDILKISIGKKKGDKDAQ